MLSKIRNALIGTPLPTQMLGEKRLNKIRALAAFSPDALSSIAYANQEIYLGLLVAGSAGLSLAWPIGLAIIGILIIVAISYFQTVHAYPSGGGSYIVARANLGVLPGLVAAAALLIDYVLTVSVSVAVIFASGLIAGLPGVTATSAAVALTHYFRARPRPHQTVFNWAVHVIAGTAPAMMTYALGLHFGIENLPVLLKEAQDEEAAEVHPVCDAMGRIT